MDARDLYSDSTVLSSDLEWTCQVAR